MLTAEQKENKTLSELKRNCMILEHEWKQTSENVVPIYCSVWGIVLQEDFQNYTPVKLELWSNAFL
jgi:hypothetical protein